MAPLIAFLNQGWVGTLLGVLGVGFAVFQTMKRSEAKPAFQYSGQKLISSEGGLLPNEVSIRYKDASVPNISITHIVFWNNGHSTIKGSDISDSHPLIFGFDKGEILQAEIVRTSREAINVSAQVKLSDPSQICFSFSFLDSNDGFLLKVLHTSDLIIPTFQGTIMGIPRGVKNLGKIDGKEREDVHIDPKLSRYARIFSILFSVTVGITIIYLPFRSRYIDDLELYYNDNTLFLTRAVMISIGASFMLSGIFTFLRTRRRFPASLSPDSN